MNIRRHLRSQTPYALTGKPARGIRAFKPAHRSIPVAELGNVIVQIHTVIPQIFRALADRNIRPGWHAIIPYIGANNSVHLFLGIAFSQAQMAASGFVVSHPNQEVIAKNLTAKMLKMFFDDLPPDLLQTIKTLGFAFKAHTHAPLLIERVSRHAQIPCGFVAYEFAKGPTATEAEANEMLLRSTAHYLQEFPFAP